jgi:GNAT superfamily N-acetyltransferase
MPAQRLETTTPQMLRALVGADADIAVFDPSRVIDKATFEKPAQHLTDSATCSSAVFVVRDGRLQENATPEGILPGETVFAHRLATPADLSALEILMAFSIRELIGRHLGPAGVQASFEIMGVDTTLIADGTYFVVEGEGRIVGCGGWSRRATLFGGDHTTGRDTRLLDTETEPVRVRAMYTHPSFARRGIGRLVLSRAKPPRAPTYLLAGARGRRGRASLRRVRVHGDRAHDVPTSTGVPSPRACMRKEFDDEAAPATPDALAFRTTSPMTRRGEPSVRRSTRLRQATASCRT